MAVIPGKKALIIAPHNDDEILGTGGVIQKICKKGGSVTIAILTNGDGQRRRPPLTPKANHIKLGYRRQEESLQSLQALGVAASDVFFPGYPDRGLSRLWNYNWNYDNLYRSKYTRTDHSPYDNSFTFKAPYCGRALVADLKEIIQDTEPDIIYLPHPNDSHFDHWSTNAFLIYSLEKLKESEEEKLDQINLSTYLVHRGRWPLPRGKRFRAGLNPPRQLHNLDTRWTKVHLSPTETQIKYSAICKHRSQTQLMKKYLMSFARANELFGKVPTLVFENSLKFQDSDDSVAAGDRQNDQKDEAFLSYLDPKQRSVLASLKRYSDIKSIDLTRKNSLIKIKVNFFNRLRFTNNVKIHINSLDAPEINEDQEGIFKFLSKKNKLYLNDRIIPPHSPVKSQTNSNSFALTIPLHKLGDPGKLLLGVELLRNSVIFAKSAYRLIKLK